MFFFLFNRIVILVLIGLVVLFLVLDRPILPYRFASFGGLLAYVLICWIFSKHRSQVSFNKAILIRKIIEYDWILLNRQKLFFK